ncbi:MAG: peptidylprolyl isomerase [Betaproteobacteria bacterium]
MRVISFTAVVAALTFACPLAAGAANPKVAVKTSMGTITIELFADKVPKTVDNFLEYAKAGFYNGTIFHRVIPGFMVQGGGFTRDMEQKPTRPSIPHEGPACATNELGTVAMARTSDPDSASSQFFINVVNNARLNHTAATPQGYGYCAFGKVTAGMEIAQKIVAVPTVTAAPNQNVPRDPILIESVTLLK